MLFLLPIGSCLHAEKHLPSFSKNIIMEKRKYDTGIILLYLLGKEHLLPKAFRKAIPYSTVSTWRKTDYSNYEGHQFRTLFDEDWNSVTEKLQRKKLETKLRIIAKTWLLFREEWRAVVSEARKDRLGCMTNCIRRLH